MCSCARRRCGWGLQLGVPLWWLGPTQCPGGGVSIASSNASCCGRVGGHLAPPKRGTKEGGGPCAAVGRKGSPSFQSRRHPSHSFLGASPDRFSLGSPFHVPSRSSASGPGPCPGVSSCTVERRSAWLRYSCESPAPRGMPDTPSLASRVPRMMCNIRHKTALCCAMPRLVRAPDGGGGGACADPACGALIGRPSSARRR